MCSGLFVHNNILLVGVMHCLAEWQVSKRVDHAVCHMDDCVICQKMDGLEFVLVALYPSLHRRLQEIYIATSSTKWKMCMQYSFFWLDLYQLYLFVVKLL